MNFPLQSDCLKKQKEFAEYVEQQVIPHTDRYEKEEAIPAGHIKELAANGFIGLTLPQQYGGSELDEITLGLLHEEMGRGYGSMENLLTVFGMVLQGILRSNNESLKHTWIPAIVRGEKIPAFALTEETAGSNIKEIRSTLTRESNQLILNGKKKWITMARIADLFLVFAKCEGKETAVIIEKDTPGLTVQPMPSVMGLKANMLGEVTFDNCRINESNAIGSIGSGFNRIGAFALSLGRYTTAWGCVGITRGCLEQTIHYSKQRYQFESQLSNFQLVQKKIAEMTCDFRTSKLLCLSAGKLMNQKSPDSINEILLAKYHASVVCLKSAINAIQIHGAVGCYDQSPVARYFRDSKLMQIIEGATEMHEIMIAKNAIAKGGAEPTW